MTTPGDSSDLAADSAPPEVQVEVQPEALPEVPAEVQAEVQPPPEFPLTDAESAPVDRVTLAFNLAKTEGQGEDADPLLLNTRDLVLLAVFDGMGGAGGTTYQTPDGPRTGAYLASRTVRPVLAQLVPDLLKANWNVEWPAATETIRSAAQQSLREQLAGLHAPVSGLRSKLLRALPTTMAAAVLQRREAESSVWSCHVLSAGDSRIYAVDPESGAHQLTVDDIRDHGDAMANLRQDSVLSNAISADTDFVIRHREVELAAPCLLVAATDGCFGYLSTPMHFEHLILSTLRDSKDATEWSALLQSAIGAVSGDDASMAILGLGTDYAGFQALFGRRVADLETAAVRPLNELAAEVERAAQRLATLEAEQSTLIAEQWMAYKPEYERYWAGSAAGRG